MQRVLLTQHQITIVCAIIKRPKKACLKRFALEMAWIIVARTGTAENREKGRRERIFSTRIHLFWMLEEHIIWTYRLPSHVIFNLLQEIKVDLKPSTRSHAIPALSKLLVFFGFRFSGFVASLFLYPLFASNLCCAWYYCIGRYVNEMFIPLPSALLWTCALVLICSV